MALNDTAWLRAECKRLEDHLCAVRVEICRPPLGFQVERMRTNLLASVMDPRRGGIKIAEGLEVVVSYRTQCKEATRRSRVYVDGYLMAVDDGRLAACKYADAFALAVNERAKAQPLVVDRLADMQGRLNRAECASAEPE